MLDVLGVGLLLLLKGPKTVVKFSTLAGRRRIRCPKCGWVPARSDRWSCGPGGCGHVWNTFETGAQCPGCERTWEETACLRCSQWSRHQDWYEDEKE